MTSWSRSRRLARSVLAALAVLPAAPVGAQIKPYKIAEADFPIDTVTAIVENDDHLLVVPADTPSELRIQVRDNGRALSLEEVEKILGTGLQVRAEMSGPGIRRTLRLPQPSDPPPPDDPLVLRLPALSVPGEYRVTGLRVVGPGRVGPVPVVPLRFMVKVRRVDGTDVPLSDTTPPGAVRNLSPDGKPLIGQVRLYWTAPGDDGASGTACRYDLRYSASPIDESNFSLATQIAPALIPGTGGSGQRLEWGGGVAPGTYYFAVKARDEAHNWSGLSNVLSVTIR